MPGPAPQPGETRGPDGNPWTSTGSGGEWWHGDTAAHPIVAPEDAAATGRLAIPGIMGPDPAGPAADPKETATQEPEQAAAPGEVGSADGDEHDATGDAHDATGDAHDATDDEHDATGDAPDATDATGDADARRPDDVPVLPEPRDRDRPVPAHPVPAGRQQPVHPDDHPRRPVRPTQVRPTQVRQTQGPPGRNRAAQHQSALVARLEASPFWLGGDEPGPGRPAEHPAQPGRLGVPPRRVPPVPRRPALGLAALVLLAMAATFFAWVSAEPLWLAVGHGERGTAVVTGCSGSGIGHRCRGDFTADGGRSAAPGVALLGVAADRRGTGSVVPARMVRDSPRAYAAPDDLALHLRWGIGVLMVLLTGLGIAATTGARRLETPRARRTAVLISLAGPLALLAGFLAMTY